MEVGFGGEPQEEWSDSTAEILRCYNSIRVDPYVEIPNPNVIPLILSYEGDDEDINELKGILSEFNSMSLVGVDLETESEDEEFLRMCKIVEAHQLYCEHFYFHVCYSSFRPIIYSLYKKIVNQISFEAKDYHDSIEEYLWAANRSLVKSKMFMFIFFSYHPARIERYKKLLKEEGTNVPYEKNGGY
jgi:hypothetical protein